VLPLHLSFLGFTGTLLRDRDRDIRSLIEAHNRARYTLIANTILGGTALLLYAKDSSVSSRIRDVEITSVGLGPLHLVNKSAVGVRMAIVDPESGAESIYTFVCAHLTAHSYNLESRNDDWRAIVSQLVFPSRSPSGGTTTWHQIYDTSHLFVFGDLNYRVTSDESDPGSVLSLIETDLPSLLLLDQLRTEHAAGRTLHYLKEGRITFKPSYKFEQGSMDVYNVRKRLPSWCDRILFATWADEEAQEEDYESDSPNRNRDENRSRRRPRVELYRSIMSFTLSDHKPVNLNTLFLYVHGLERTYDISCAL
jgi:hypothetical protein